MPPPPRPWLSESCQLPRSEPKPGDFGNGRNQPEHPRWTSGNWLHSRCHFAFAGYRNEHAAPDAAAILRVRLGVDVKTILTRPSTFRRQNSQG
jgi:hypothetical protein